MGTESKVTFWNPEQVEFVFQSYLLLERKLLEILKVLPLTPENENSWSPELVNIFLDTSSLFESVCKYGALYESSEPKITEMKEKFLEKDEINQARAIVYVYPIRILNPYDHFSSADGWWRVYQGFKHNRIENYKQANLINTLNVLAALFLILAKYKQEEFSKALLRFRITDTGFAPEFFHRERSGDPHKFWYDSELFGTPEQTNSLSSNDPADIKTYGSKKFHAFMGRFNLAA